MKKTDQERRANPDGTLENAYSLIRQHLLTKKSNFWVGRKINELAGKIHKKGWLSLDEIHHHVFLRFMEERKHEKFDAQRSALSTYTAYHTFYEVKSLNENFRRISKGMQLTPVGDYLWVAYTRGSNNVVATDRPINVNLVPVKSQCDLLDRLIENTTPEDHLIRKEFWNIVAGCYDEIDAMVLMGAMTRKVAAAELGIEYESYCKRLQRKNSSFRVIATKAGYC